ncbi:hypothetical protein AERO9AM_20776 [Aeromicrobium sp. 9AM]|nr:hypothetical protein AERO9AM_20776 [Aeromicrobium sp. 9AM]
MAVKWAIFALLAPIDNLGHAA